MDLVRTALRGTPSPIVMGYWIPETADYAKRLLEEAASPFRHSDGVTSVTKGNQTAVERSTAQFPRSGVNEDGFTSPPLSLAS